jgi:hypothetical protein
MLKEQGMTKELIEEGEMRLLAIKLAAAERDKLEDEIVALDSSVAQTNEKIKSLSAGVQALNESYNFQWQDRKTKLQRHEKLGELVRDLKRGREGWPWLTDEEYEARMTDVHAQIEGLLDLSTPVFAPGGF